MLHRTLDSPRARFAVGIASLLTYSAILIGAGHGAGPIGLLLIFGSPEVWWMPQLFGWIGVVLEIVALFKVSKSSWRLLAACSEAGQLSSATLFVFQSETLHYLDSFGGFMIPFTIVFIFRVTQILLARSA